MSLPIVVVGAGLAGLSCALELRARGLEVQVLEASDGVGGRVRTDRVDGFLLDRGFQVLLSGYPECRRQLDYAALDLLPFFPGAVVQRGGRAITVADPRKHPVQALGALNGLASPADAPALLRLLADSRRTVRRGLDVTGPDAQTTREALRAAGLSDRLVDGFFRPFLAGITLDPTLTVWRASPASSSAPSSTATPSCPRRGWAGSRSSSRRGSRSGRCGSARGSSTSTRTA